MASMRRTIIRGIKRKTSGKYAWNDNGNRRSRRTKRKDK